MKGGERRLTRHEAFDAMVTAGIELLLDYGLSTGLGKVTFAAAIERSAVPRQSAYRAFDDPKYAVQEALHVAVIERLGLYLSRDNERHPFDLQWDERHGTIFGESHKRDCQDSHLHGSSRRLCALARRAR